MLIETTYKVGQLIEIDKLSCVHVLALVDMNNKMALLPLNASCNRVRNPASVEDIMRITRKEMIGISGSSDVKVVGMMPGILKGKDHGDF